MIKADTKRATIASSVGLVSMAAEAQEHDRNRQFDPEDLEKQLAPKGLHVVGLQFMHAHVAGKRTEPHWRVKWLCMFKDRAQHVVVWLDVGLDEFDKSTSEVRFDNSPAVDFDSLIDMARGKK